MCGWDSLDCCPVKYASVWGERGREECVCGCVGVGVDCGGVV